MDRPMILLLAGGAGLQAIDQMLHDPRIDGLDDLKVLLGDSEEPYTGVHVITLPEDRLMEEVFEYPLPLPRIPRQHFRELEWKGKNMKSQLQRVRRKR